MQRLCPTLRFASFIVRQRRRHHVNLLHKQPREHDGAAHPCSPISYSQRSFFSSNTTHHRSSSLSIDNNDKASKIPSLITFLTDVEGDGLYFDRFIHHSKILGFRSISPSFGRYSVKQGMGKFGGDGSANDNNGSVMKWNYGHHDEEYFPYDKEVVFLDDNSILVYGGDVWDKGGLDLYVMRQLLSLRRRYPDRVHFLMGNRDINKMRIVDELGGFDGNIGDSTALPKHEGVYWQVRGLLPTDPKPSIPSNSAAERLKWMLKNTMGSIHAFEFRRDELIRERIAIMNESYVSPAHEPDDHILSTNVLVTVSDDEVARSYISSCCPISGIMSQYLMHAKLVIRFGSVLFMHGALPIDSKLDADDQFNHFPTPWLRPTNDGSTATCINSLAEWIGALNGFASSQVKAWKEFGQSPRSTLLNSSDNDDGVWATNGGYFNNTKAGKMFGALMQYGMGRLSDNATTQSCVYSAWMHNGLPREDIFGCKNSMTTFSRLLQKEGIQIILTGHRPVGDAPWPIKIPHDGENTSAWVLPCDTSYSGDTRWTSIEGLESFDSHSLGRGLAKSGRGEVAFSEPLVRVCPATGNVNSLQIHGCLSDGSYYKTENMMNVDDSDNLLYGRSHGPAVFKDKESGDSKEGMFWVKSRVGDRHLVSFGKGYYVWNSYITPYPPSTATT